eukprot:09151.XXX_298453_298575_1 [CDS] Oithona nana genome sequencing.
MLGRLDCIRSKNQVWSGSQSCSCQNSWKDYNDQHHDPNHR